MAETISTWIRSRLGVIIDLTPSSIGNCCRDGTFYGKLLHSYAIINESQLNTIKHTSDPALARVNLRHLQVWLRFIGVDCDQESIQDISNGKGSAALNLLYKIFLCLENKDRLHFITLEKEREKYIPTSTKFDVKVVSEEPEFDASLPEHPLLKLLESNTSLSSSHKQEFQKMISDYLRGRHSKVRFSQTSETETVSQDSGDKLLKNKPISRQFNREEVKKSAKSKVLAELDEFAEKHADVSHSQSETYEIHGRPEAAKKYIEELKARRKREAEIQQRSNQIQNTVLSRFWEKFENDRERKFDEITARTVLRQSRYEKKMVTKLCEIHAQKDRLAANRQMVDELMFKAKEDHARLIQESKREMKLWDNEELGDEARRFNELQRRMQDEKKEKVKLEIIKTAQDIVGDLVVLAVNSVDSEIPRSLWNKWKSLFIKGIKIFPSRQEASNEGHNTVENRFGSKADYEDKSEQEPKEDPEVISDYNLQEDALIDKDLYDYLNINAPWSEFTPEIDQQNKEFIDLGSVVLGYVVNKLLQEFPYEPMRPKLPEVKVRAVILGVPDSNNYLTIQDLLKHKKISVIRVEDAINYCLQCYKEEMKDFDHVEVRKLETESESSINLKSLERDDKNKSTIVNKKTQTPKVIPYDDMHPTLSDSAYIGKWIHEFFLLGEPISDELMSKIIFEHLNNINTKGWVLINYPETYRQLAYLEFSLSGKSTCDIEKVFNFNEDDTEDTEFEPRIKYSHPETTFYRESKLLPNPVIKSDDKFNSCLTAYIKMLPKPKEVDANAEELFEVRAEDATRLDEFYSQQGIAKVVYYDQCDNATLKRVARLVIGDVKLPRKSSAEMFGSAASKDGAEDKSSEILTNSSAKSLKSLESSQSQEDKAKPGEENWTWTDLPLTLEVTKALMSLWRNCENTYVDGLKDILSLKRLNLTAIIPYKDYVYNRVIQYRSKEGGGDKLEVVQKFKSELNDVLGSGKVTENVKNELCSKLDEFQMELWEICDVKRRQAEEERKKIVEDDWATKQIIVLVNVYVTIIQIEMDRFVDTLQFLRSYYLTMLKRAIGDNIFKKILLDKFITGNGNDTEGKGSIKFPKLPEINDTALKKEISNLMTNADDNLLNQTKSHCLEIIKPTVSYAESTIEDLSTSALDDLKKERILKSKRRSSEIKESKVKKKVTKSSETSVKTKKITSVTKKKKNLFLEWEYALMYEINRIKMRIKIIKSAIEVDVGFLLGNIRRGFISAYQSINERYKSEINNVDYLIKLFHIAIDDGRIFEEEIVLVDDCFVIQRDLSTIDTLASEDDKSDDFKFRIEQLWYLKDVLQSVEPSGIISKVPFVYILQDLVICTEDGEDEEEEEELGEGEYKISSLPKAWFELTPGEIEEIVDEIFKDDTVDWREFIIYALDIYLSQDALLDALYAFKKLDTNNDEIISTEEFLSVHLSPFNLESDHEADEKVVREEIFDKEIEKEILEKEILKNIDRNNGIKLENEQTVEVTGGNEEIVDGKEINREEESSDEEIERLYLMKLFVCKIFSIDDDNNVNYMEILFAFCKDDNPVYGFGKALSVALGQDICLDYEEGERYVVNVEKKYLAKEVRKQAKEMCRRCVDQLIDGVINYCDGSAIEINETANVKSDDNPYEDDDMQVMTHKDDIDLVLINNEDFYDYQNHNVIYFNAGGHRARRTSTRKVIYWISINLCEAVLVKLLPNKVIEHINISTEMSLNENLQVVSSEVQCNIKMNPKFVLAHRLIRHDFIIKLLESTNKFTNKNLNSVVRKIMEERK
ncbi:uncharacterized protein LOC130668606 [Microplitis mediator]|uniref:uncharacterized protein LOC130668606 n=1 Tax=Microplitis mediator TaxID=375433 RepID=UPI002557600C|nr:uncharacterized protein LOC130668606 [Microplitis mediator]